MDNELSALQVTRVSLVGIYSMLAMPMVLVVASAPAQASPLGLEADGCPTTSLGKRVEIAYNVDYHVPLGPNDGIALDYARSNVGYFRHMGQAWNGNNVYLVYGIADAVCDLLQPLPPLDPGCWIDAVLRALQPAASIEQLVAVLSDASTCLA